MRSSAQISDRLSRPIPPYLRPYIVRQDASLYTPMDHASWRFILKIARAFFARHAHQKYLDGLRETGISTERIPLIEEMDLRLRDHGWRAVAVSGFIPPAVFMEFLSLGILPIACDMRTIEHLAYTPAPDIVHEAAGHAPILADPEYAEYLFEYGELAKKVIFSKHDLDVYQAIRVLSDVKEDPRSSEADIAHAQTRLDAANAAVEYESEATLLSRMGWWTFEYGLVGPLDDPKIYGAGLLSSLGESYHFLGPGVKRVPFSIRCTEVTYDITRPQPQLFVARDFHALTEGLREFAATMAFRRGGLESLEKAQRAQTVTTTELDSGVQISGVLARVLSELGEPYYLGWSGPCQLAVGDRELPGHGPAYHAQGFGTPIGKLRSPAKRARELVETDFTHPRARLEFQSGVVVTGVFKGLLREGSVTRVVTFEDCTVSRGGEILFRPEWGTFDMACGEEAPSVFGGAADRQSYLEATGGFHQEPGKPKTNLTESNRPLNALYARVRAARATGAAGAAAELAAVHAELERSHPHDWLLRYELLELANGSEAAWVPAARRRLEEIAASSREKGEMITRGLALL
jgi:phenylalanine-4-hydroxylase